LGDLHDVQGWNGCCGSARLALAGGQNLRMVFGYCSLEGRLKTLMMYRSGMDVADVPDLHWLEAKA